MLLPFTDGLVITTHFDWEMSWLADRHYSRRTVGARQFLYSGRKLVLRNTEGSVLFGWVWPEDDMRMDGQTGYNCAIFRNESPRKSSDIILEAERFAIAKWGGNRMYTYVDPAKIRTVKVRGVDMPGFCYIKAGWQYVLDDAGQRHLSKAGQVLLTKYEPA